MFDSDRRRLFGCNEYLILVPFLNKDISKSKNKKERWWFGLEEIPIACMCSLKSLNPLK